MKRFRIYDDGKSGDRFTFVIRENDSNILHFYASSEEPFKPWGIGQYCGDSNTNMTAGKHLGKKVKDYRLLPSAVLAFFAQSVRACGYDYHKVNAKEALS